MIEREYAGGALRQISIAEHARNIKKEIAGSVSASRISGAGFIDVKIDCRSNVRESKGVNEVVMDIDNGIILKHRAGIPLHVDRVIDIPENVASGDKRRISSSVA